MKTIALILLAVIAAGCGAPVSDAEVLLASTIETPAQTPEIAPEPTPTPSPSPSPHPIMALVGTWKYYASECNGVLTFPGVYDGMTSMSIHNTGLMNLETYVPSCGSLKVTSQYTFIPTATEYTLDRVKMFNHSFASGASCTTPIEMLPGYVSWNPLHEVYQYEVGATVLMFYKDSVCDAQGNVYKTYYHRVSDVPRR